MLTFHFSFFHSFIFAGLLLRPHRDESQPLRSRSNQRGRQRRSHRRGRRLEIRRHQPLLHRLCRGLSLLEGLHQRRSRRLPLLPLPKLLLAVSACHQPHTRPLLGLRCLQSAETHERIAALRLHRRLVRLPMGRLLQRPMHRVSQHAARPEIQPHAGTLPQHVLQSAHLHGIRPPGQHRHLWRHAMPRVRPGQDTRRDRRSLRHPGGNLRLHVPYA